jgi:hypothetical protein
MIILFIAVFVLSLSNERKIILKELGNEKEISLLSPEHIEILSTLKRNKKGWIKEEFRKDYIKNAVKYAFRKHQFKNCKGSSKYFYQKEIDKLKITLTDIVHKIKIDFGEDLK